MSPDSNLIKVNMCNVLVGVKFYDVPITAYTEDELSAIATKLGSSLILDSYTSVICTKSWGGSSFARAMTELRANMELKDMHVVAVPKIEDESKQVEDNGQKDKHLSLLSTSLCDSPLSEKEVNLTSASIPSTAMEEQVEKSYSEVEDIDGDTARFMASLSNRAGGGANDASLLEDEDYGIYDGYKDDAYDLSEEQLVLCNAFNITLRSRVRK
ncbi:hypothetical protein Tco_0331054 [Tanacetum coccineum]